MKKQLWSDITASFAPLLVYIIVIVMIGFLHGVFSIIINALSNSDTGFNVLIYQVWVLLAIFIFIFMTAWLIFKAQKQQFIGGQL